ncbi:MAG: hypothetical protein NT155_00635 [Candidatus Staskawiczbacteria bacterium]|nr:hypothetical protein [Candidatus Staskawiczbacteria bacterium]
MNQEIRNCQNCKKDFVIESDDFDFYEKMKVPAPTFCPMCRMVRRMTWRNERSFYKRKCGLTNESIISVFSPEKPYKVYSSKAWWGDSWDGIDYGVDYDFGKNFFIQFDLLLKRVPLMNLYGLYTTVINSDYTNMVSNLKNSYMVTYADFSENCAYGSFVNNSKDCVDNSMINKCELCYDTVNCKKCYKTYYSVDCEDCVEVLLSKSCIGCSNCFGCVNLRKKNYCIENVQYTKEEYEKFINSIIPLKRNKIKEFKEKFHNFWIKFPVKYIHGSHNVDVSGDYVYNSKNSHGCYVVGDLENCKYCSYVTPDAGGLKDSYDSTHYVIQSELTYECLQSGHQASRTLFSLLAISGVVDIEYCVMVVNCKNCFGCVGLKNKQYCILNKQYSKEEYFGLRDKIKEHMNSKPYITKRELIYKYGEFFPEELSPFGYNETSAQDFMPINKKEADDKGYKWYEKIDNKYKSTISSMDLPETIQETTDDILGEIILCEKSGKVYKINSLELNFLKKNGLPIPDEHPELRHSERSQFINKPFFYDRSCAKCGKGIEASYAPDRPEIVYCESCYNSEVA